MTQKKCKVINVRFEDDVISISIPIKIRSEDLTVGWLFSEVQRQYSKYIEHVNKSSYKVAKRFMTALKTEDGIPTMDYYLTDMAK